MWRIGITGSIATGKSTVLTAFADLGVPVFSADQAVAELYAGDAVAPVEALFPGVTKAGVIDKSRLSARLGADPDGFAVQFAILGAAIASRIERSVGEARKAVELAGELNYSPEAVAEKVLKDVPAFRDMKQLADSLKTAIKNSSGRAGGSGSVGLCSWILVGTSLVNTALILCLMLRY